MPETLSDWLRGDLSPAARILTAALPALVIGLWVCGGMLVFAVRNRSRGPFRDPDVEARGATPLIGMWLRRYFVWLMRPILALLVRANLPPSAITTLALLLATGSAIAVAAGRMALGGWMFVAAGACDFFHGRVARESRRATPSGAVLDSVLDRYVEAAVFVGLAWFYRDSWVLIAVLFALVGSLVVPYVRARGEALGVEFPNVGFVQRPERVALLGLSLALSPIVEALLLPSEPRPIHRLAVIGIVGLAAATHVTAVQRLIHAHRVLSGEPLQRPRVLGRGGIVRNAISSAIATGSDFALVALLVSGLAFQAPLATFLGCLLGGVVNFSVNRIWAFGSKAPTGRQALRYLFVTGSSAVLNSGLVAVLLLLPGVPYVIAWWLVRGAVFATWNYPLNRDYVFLRTSGEDARAV